MALFAVKLSDETTDIISEADCYQQEGPMTTFFAFGNDRTIIDSWSLRLASYRTADISAIRRSSKVSNNEHQMSQADLAIA